MGLARIIAPEGLMNSELKSKALVLLTHLMVIHGVLAATVFFVREAGPAARTAQRSCCFGISQGGR